MPSGRLQPYLGLRARLSLAWANHLLIPIAFGIASLLLALVTIRIGADDAVRDFTAACAGTQQAATLAANVPRLAATNVNQMTAASTEAFVHGSADVMTLGLTATEALVDFMVDTYQGLYLCLGELVVRGSLGLAISASEELGNLTQSAVQSVRSDIQGSVTSINSAIAAFVSTVDKIPGVNFKAPSFDVPSLDGLSNIQLPASLTDSLLTLNNSLPTLDQLRADLQVVIAKPFDSVKASINSSIGSFVFDQSLLAVPQARSVDLCSNLDTSFISDIANELLKGVRIALALLIAAAVLLVIALLLLERHSFRSKVAFVERYRAQHADRPADAFAISSLFAFLDAAHHPILQFILQRCGQVSPRVVWLALYVTHPAALAILGVGLLTLVLVEAGIAVLSVSTAIVDALNGSMNATSADYAASANAAITGYQTSMNADLFGPVNVTTTALNQTLNAFYDGLIAVVNGTFGNTPLATPALGLINCLIGRKIVGIERGLTFISENARLTLPTISPSALMLSPAATNELAKQVSDTGSGDAAATIDRLLSRYAAALDNQRILALVLIALYLVVVLIAFICFVHSGRADQEHVAPPPSPADTEKQGFNDDKRLPTPQGRRIRFASMVESITSAAQYGVRSARQLGSTLARRDETEPRPPPYRAPSPAPTSVLPRKLILVPSKAKASRPRISRPIRRPESQIGLLDRRSSVYTLDDRLYTLPHGRPVSTSSSLDHRPDFHNPFATPFDAINEE